MLGRALAFLPLVACAVAAAPSGPPDGGGDHATAPPPDASDDEASSTLDAAPDVTSPDLACAIATTQDECLTCCENDHPTASNVVNQALFTCACTPSVCADACAASFCIDKGADQACVACLQPTLTGVCLQPLNSACAADAECTAWKNCQIPCPTRPP